MAQHRILVTGADGFVGKWVSKVFSEGAEPPIVVATSRSAEAGTQRMDVRDFEQVQRVVREVRPTAVVHLAAISSPVDAKRQPNLAWEVNATGTLNLALAVMQEASAAQFIFASSAEVYGTSFNELVEPIREETPLRPTSAYGATKAAAELALLQMAKDGLKAICFRPFNHTGPGQSVNFVIPAFASQLGRVAAGKAPPVIEVGDLTASRDFLHVRDVARAYVQAALHECSEAHGRAINLSSGLAHRIGSILEAMIALSGLRVEVKVDPNRFRTSEVPVAAGASDLAKRLFDWRPEIGLLETLCEVLTDWSVPISVDYGEDRIIGKFNRQE